jgi:hypothetical protein
VLQKGGTLMGTLFQKTQLDGWGLGWGRGGAVGGGGGGGGERDERRDCVESH